MITPFKAQQEILDSNVQFKVVSKGRRAGGTVLNCLASIKLAAFEAKRVIMICIDQHNLISTWDIMYQCLYQHPLALTLDQGRHEIHIGKGRILMVTGQSNKIRGLITPNDSVIVDEAAYAEEIVHESMSIVREKGSGLLMSTPRGRNTFWEYYMRGLDPLVENWTSYRLPSSENPYAKDLSALQFAERWQQEAFLNGKFYEEGDSIPEES